MHDGKIVVYVPVYTIVKGIVDDVPGLHFMKENVVEVPLSRVTKEIQEETVDIPLQCFPSSRERGASRSSAGRERGP